MISYAGVVLDFPPPGVLSRVRRHLSYDWLRLWDEPWNWTPPRSLPVRAWDPWPVRGPQALPSRPWLQSGPLRLNTLLWPSGASRWGVFHALVDDATMTAIKGATGSFGQPLTISDGGPGPALSVVMYPLPPRPLSQIPGSNGLQLLTLLDRRAYWPWLAADVGVVGGEVSWASLFAMIASALGVTLAVDDVPAAYLMPPSSLSGAYGSLPALLDAACLSCGLRFAAALDGATYRCWSVAAAQQQVARNLATPNQRVAGGLFLQGTDLNGVIPAAVQVVFPRADDGTPNPAPSVGLVTLASLNLPSNPPGGPAVGGIGGLVKTFHSTAVATFASGSATNAATLAALSGQVATDYYAWQATGVYDVAFAGVAPWLPTGADGLCEYVHGPDGGAGGGVLSRFRRDTYFDQQDSLFHHTVTPCAAIPTRVRVVGTTLTDSCLYAAELVVRSGCGDTAVSPAVDVWLRIDGLVGAPDAGEVHLASPEGVRVTDGLPVYVAVVSGAAAAPPFAAHTVRGISNLLADANVQQMGNNYKGFDGVFLNNPADAVPGNLAPSLQIYLDADAAQPIGNTVAIGTGFTAGFTPGSPTGAGFNQPRIPFSNRGGLVTPLLAFTHLNNPPVAAGSLGEAVYVTSQQGGGSSGIVVGYRDGSLNYYTLALVTQAQAAFYAPLYGAGFGIADPATGSLSAGIPSSQITGTIGGGSF